MALYAKPFARMVVEMVELASPPMSVPVLRDLQAQAVKLILMNVQMALFSVTAVPPVLTYLDGTTVSAGMVTTIMACFHLVENHVKILMNVQPGGTAVPMTQFVLIWMVAMTVDAHMGRTAQETVSMKARSNTMDKSGCWKMIDALFALAKVAM